MNYLLSFKKLIFSAVLISVGLYTSHSHAMKRDEDKEELVSSSVQKKGKPESAEEVYESKPSESSALQNLYLSRTIPFISRFLSNQDRGRLACVSKLCNEAFYKGNPNPWSNSNFVVFLDNSEKGIFSSSYPIKSLTVLLDDYSKVKQMGAFFEWIVKISPYHLGIKYKQESGAIFNIHIFGMALYMMRNQLKSIRSLELHGIYNLGDKFYTIEVIQEGLASLFPQLESLKLDDCFFYRTIEDEKAEPQWLYEDFADKLTQLRTLIVSNRRTCVIELKQFFVPTVEHLCLNNLDIERDFDDMKKGHEFYNESEAEQRGLSLFKGMPRLRTINLENVDFHNSYIDEVHLEGEESPCSEEQLMSWMETFMNLRDLQEINITGGNWVTAENRKTMTDLFRQKLHWVPKLTLNW